MGASNALPAAGAKLLIALGSRPQEITLDELFDVFGLDGERFFLTRLAHADSMLRNYGVDVQPRLQDQSPDGRYVLRIEQVRPPTDADLLECLAAGETAKQEFKSTYWYDLQRSSKQANATANQLRSEDVRHSALKSVAGFLTTGGGTLFIGVDDAGDVLGIGPDIQILKGRRNIDQLINIIKTDIAHRFRDGNTINDYVRIAAVPVGNEQVLRLEVTSRHTLSFLTYEGRTVRLYRRQDNRTVQVEIFELEEFQAWRRRHVLNERV